MRSLFPDLVVCQGIPHGAEAVQFAKEIENPCDGVSVLQVRPSQQAALQAVPVVTSCRKYRLADTAVEIGFRVAKLAVPRLAAEMPPTYVGALRRCLAFLLGHAHCGRAYRQ